MRLLIALGASACLVLVAGIGKVAHAQDELCGPADDRYVCGQIIIGLNPEVQAIVEDVVARHGHDPATAILDEITADTFVIAVPVGEETAWVESYGADPDVAFAELNRVAETQVPDTAAVGTGANLALAGLVLLAFALLTSVRVSVKVATRWQP